MPAYELRLDGHTTGLACTLAARLESRLPFAAFKMAHPLEVRASVILDARDDLEARTECATACTQVAADLRALLGQLPPDPSSKHMAWPERQLRSPPVVTLRPRDVKDEA